MNLNLTGHMTPDNLKLLFYTGCIVGVLTIVAIFLALLVRYAVLFAVLGAVGVIASMTLVPKSLATQVSGYLLGGGLGLFVLLLLTYEFVQWRRHKHMLSVRASFWNNGWRSARNQQRLRNNQTKRRIQNRNKPVSGRYR